MDINQALRKLDSYEIQSKYSYNATEIMKELINDNPDDFGKNYFTDFLWNSADNEFIYYSNAWNYLMDNNINDFEEAIKEIGASNVCQIACYYLINELMQLYYELGGE